MDGKHGNGNSTVRLDLGTKIALIAALIFSSSSDVTEDDAVETAVRLEQKATDRVNEMKAATQAAKEHGRA